MTVASRIITSLNAGFTQTQLRDAINAALLNAGLTAFSSFTSGTDQNLIYSFSSGSGTYATTYYRVRIQSNFTVSHQILSTWNTGTNSGTNSSSDTNTVTYSNQFNISFHALNALPEYAQVLIIQNSVTQVLGVMNPQLKSSVWDLNSWNHAFIANATSLISWVSTTNNPFSNNNFTFGDVGNSLIASPSLVFNATAMGGGIRIMNNGGVSLWTQTSNDLAVAPCGNLPRGQTFTIAGDNKLWLPLCYTNGGLCVCVSS